MARARPIAIGKQDAIETNNAAPAIQIRKKMCVVARNAFVTVPAMHGEPSLHEEGDYQYVVEWRVDTFKRQKKKVRQWFKTAAPDDAEIRVPSSARART